MNMDAYDAARDRAVIAQRTDRSFVRVHGRDPVKMVQGLISNDIANAPPDRAVYAAVLTPKGKMVADMRVLRHGPDLLLETDRDAADGVMMHLRKFVPPLFARFEDATGAWAGLGVYGPLAGDVVSRAFGVELGDAGREDDLVAMSLDDVPVQIIATSMFDVPGFDIVLGAGALERAHQLLSDAGATPIDLATLDVLRIEAGRPRWGTELTGTTIPLEAGLRERAISETKGCYTGQEVIIRILHRGHVNWLLRMVLMGDAAPPPYDTGLFAPADGKKVGRVTSAVQSPKYGQTIGLAYVRREVEPGAEVRLGEPDGSLVTVDAAAAGRTS